MNSLERIRRQVFGALQRDFAAVAGVSQGTVSRWERDTLEPTRDQLRRIRDEAIRRNLMWNDSWFFEPAPGTDVT